MAAMPARLVSTLEQEPHFHFLFVEMLQWS